MPLFEYRCGRCGTLFERLVAHAGAAPGACPKCGAKEVAKQFSTFSARQAPEAGLPSCASGQCSASACSSGACPMTSG